MLYDPATLASLVRELALRSNRVLKDPNARSVDLLNLSRRIAELRRQLRNTSFHDLSLWTDRLEERVDAALIAECQRVHSRVA
ncbi:MAG: hypothetical protein P4L84_04550 [Isosphaeraceae bacterium]|nr:hypothetical protein [Isosphaeraceae bacterium]